VGDILAFLTVSLGALGAAPGSRASGGLRQAMWVTYWHSSQKLFSVVLRSLRILLATALGTLITLCTRNGRFPCMHLLDGGSGLHLITLSTCDGCFFCTCCLADQACTWDGCFPCTCCMADQACTWDGRFPCTCCMADQACRSTWDGCFPCTCCMVDQACTKVILVSSRQGRHLLAILL